MKWIKVTDRLPNKGDLYFVKVKEINQDDSDWFPDTCNFYDEWQMAGREYVVIEWLDEECEKEVAYRAWRAAADAFRMYPNNKHTFSDYWETVKQ